MESPTALEAARCVGLQGGEARDVAAGLCRAGEVVLCVVRGHDARSLAAKVRPVPPLGHHGLVCFCGVSQPCRDPCRCSCAGLLMLCCQFGGGVIPFIARFLTLVVGDFAEAVCVCLFRHGTKMCRSACA